jgi:predicted phage terminase large subunit-like protein
MPKIRVAVVAPTFGDGRDVCFEGESGLCNVIDGNLIDTWNRSLGELILVNGSRFHLYSAEKPDSLRGPQHHYAWCDEMAAWDNGGPKLRETWDMMQFGLRLGQRPQTVITTTPKPATLFRELLNEKDTLFTRGSTHENKDNLAPKFFKQITKYEGTLLGRQEIHAELIDLEESGIIKRSWFSLWPKDKPLPEFRYIIQSYDTAFTDKTHSDFSVGQTWGVFKYQGELHAMLIDTWQDKMEFPDLREKVFEAYQTTYGVSFKRPDVVLIEHKGSGISLCQELIRAGVPVKKYNPGKADKTQRAHAISYITKDRRLWLPESEKHPGHPRTWCNEFLNQVCIFPNGEHDDHMDAFSQAMKLLVNEELLEHHFVVPLPEDYYREDSRVGNPYA